MMDCAHYRCSLLAAPHDPDTALSEHRESCHDCNQYTEQLLRFESRLKRALRVAVPTPMRSATRADSARQEDSAALEDSMAPGDTASQLDTGKLLAEPVAPIRAKSPPLRLAAYRRGALAMAASVLLALVVAGGLWLGVPGSSVAADVVTHMRGEPDAWRRTDVPVPIASLRDVLGESQLRLAAGAGIVSYANSCEFRGHRVPHLVIQTESGPVTVMVLVHEHVSKPLQFDEQGYRGVIVPVAGHGSLAVLTRGAATDLKTIERITRRVLDSIVWTG